MDVLERQALIKIMLLLAKNSALEVNRIATLQISRFKNKRNNKQPNKGILWHQSLIGVWQGPKIVSKDANETEARAYFCWHSVTNVFSLRILVLQKKLKRIIYRYIQSQRYIFMMQQEKKL